MERATGGVCLRVGVCGRVCVARVGCSGLPWAAVGFCREQPAGNRVARKRPGGLGKCVCCPCFIRRAVVRLFQVQYCTCYMQLILSRQRTVDTTLDPPSTAARPPGVVLPALCSQPKERLCLCLRLPPHAVAIRPNGHASARPVSAAQAAEEDQRAAHILQQ